MTSATVTSDLWFLRIRRTPQRSPDNVMGAIRNGAKVQVLEERLDGWSRISVSPDDVFITSGTPPTEGWVMSGLITVELPPPPPPPTSTKPLIGVHAIGDGDAAVEAVTQLKAPIVTIMHNKLLAIQLAQQAPQTTIIYRGWLNGTNVSPQQMLDKLEVGNGANDPKIGYVGRNENDEGIGCDPDGIKRRAGFDIEVARGIKRYHPSAFYLAGSYSMGTPDYTDPNVCNAIRSYYSDAYNTGLMGWDNHNYSPTLGWNTDGKSPWWLTRWQFLFTLCGFDPRVRNVWATETGLDEGGVGGFGAHGVDDAGFRDWLVYNEKEQSKPLVIDNKHPLILAGKVPPSPFPGVWPSPFVGSTIFQYGRDSSWAGYDVRRYKEVLRAWWA
jgi:hypothetical protein